MYEKSYRVEAIKELFEVYKSRIFKSQVKGKKESLIDYFFDVANDVISEGVISPTSSATIELHRLGLLKAKELKSSFRLTFTENSPYCGVANSILRRMFLVDIKKGQQKGKDGERIQEYVTEPTTVRDLILNSMAKW